MTFPPSSNLYSSKTGNPSLSLKTVCLNAKIFPAPVTKSQRLPESNFGLQFTFKTSSSLVENKDPIKID